MGGRPAKAQSSDEAARARTDGGRDDHPRVGGVLGLQRSVGNKATMLALQRRFGAYTVTASTHLRKGTPGPTPKVTTMRWGWTGAELKAGDPLIVDPAEHKGGWARATRLPYDQWNSQGPSDKTFVRTSKVRAVNGPVVGDQWFHPKLGLCRIVSPHVGIVTGAILKSSSSRTFIKVLAGGNETEDAATLTLAEHRMLGDLVDKDATTEDGQAIYGLLSKQGYFKTNGDTNPLVQITPTATEKIRLFEGSQKQAVAERKQLAEDLDPNRPTSTVIVPYQAKGMDGAVSVKITGKVGAPFYIRQKTAIEKALAKLKDHKVPIADGLELVISSTSDARLKNEAFHTGAGVIFLRANIFDHKPTTSEANPEEIRGGVPTAGILGVTHQLAIQEGVDDSEEQIAVGTVIHEIGHVIHRTASPATFDKYRMGLDKVEERTGEAVSDQELKRLAVLTKKISHYASNAGYGNVTELVAEVFTGVTNGLKYPAEVIAAYLKYGGVKTWDNDADVTEG